MNLDVLTPALYLLPHHALSGNPLSRFSHHAIGVRSAITQNRFDESPVTSLIKLAIEVFPHQERLHLQWQNRIPLWSDHSISAPLLRTRDRFGLDLSQAHPRPLRFFSPDAAISQRLQRPHDSTLGSFSLGYFPKPYTIRLNSSRLPWRVHDRRLFCDPLLLILQENSAHQRMHRAFCPCDTCHHALQISLHAPTIPR
jgi:hypothetical protein